VVTWPSPQNASRRLYITGVFSCYWAEIVRIKKNNVSLEEDKYVTNGQNIDVIICISHNKEVMMVMKRIICMVLFACFTVGVGNAHAQSEITILLQRVYVDGDISEEIYTTDKLSLDYLLQKYEGWKLVDYDDEQITFQKHIDDISPIIKTSGYFGLGDDGTLKIFEGTPSEDKVIHSFFQMDTKKLQSYKKQQLKCGIRVKSKTTFEKVLKDLKNYAKEN
jgi:forespore regulator of the sigma-K checkpoint